MTGTERHTSSWYDLFPILINNNNQLIGNILLVFFIVSVLAVYSHWKLRNTETCIIPSPKISVIVLLEVIIEIFINTMKTIIGHDYKQHVPVIGSVTLFVLFSNLLGLIPGFEPVLGNLFTSCTCGMIIFLYFNYAGFKKQGLQHIIHTMNPIGKKWGWFMFPLLFPIEIISLSARPLSLGVRLVGNITGDHEALLVFAGIMPFLLPVPFFALGLLVAILQTAVFFILSCVYVSLHTKEIGNH